MSLAYPRAHRLDLVETIHGREVADPYRWLEDASAPETQDWSRAQDDLVPPYLRSLPGRDGLRERLRELIPGFLGPPYILGSRAFFTRRLPEEEHAVYCVREGDGTERVLIDPNALSEDRTVTLDAVSPSKEGDLLAYQLSQGGDEESTLWVMDVATGETVEGPIDRCRYSSIAWLPGGEVYYYVRRLPPDAVPEGEAQFHRRVYRHRVGADPEIDDLVFGEGRDKITYYGLSTSRDGRWLVVSCSLGTAPRNDLYIAHLGSGGGFRPIQEGVDALTWAHVHLDGRLYVSTNLDAPRWRLAVADPRSPGPDGWRDLLPQTDAVLAGYALTDDAVVAVRQQHAVGSVTVHDLATGEARTDVPLPGLGSAGVVSRPEGGDDVWIGYSDHLTPYTVFHYSVRTTLLETWATAPGSPEVKGIRARQVFYTSKDGTEVPMFLIAREDAEPDGRRPTIVTGYGGFNAPMVPAFASTALAWAERGGVYAIACLRGGSEYGEEWHRAGMREHKQNVFDDFIAGAEHLVADGWTSPEHLAISGGSNGGLLVGAALTQRPDLYRAVVCSAPLLDMVRYERFGLGVTWNDEYGTADHAEEFGWLIGYSPYHRVRAGTAYPAVLFTVFDNDTRVDPMHARKMCAALQHATTSGLPVLLRREEQVGHGPRAVSRTIELAADTMAFLGAHTGLDL